MMGRVRGFVSLALGNMSKAQSSAVPVLGPMSKNPVAW